MKNLVKSLIVLGIVSVIAFSCSDPMDELGVQEVKELPAATDPDDNDTSKGKNG